MLVSKWKKYFAVLLLLVLLPLAACGNAVGNAEAVANTDDITEEQLDLRNFLMLATTVQITHGDTGENQDDKNNMDLLAEYDALTKEEKIAYLRHAIEADLVQNEDVGGVDWQMAIADRAVKDIFPDLYEQIARQHKEIKTEIFSYGYFTYHVITDENGCLTQVVELAADGSVNRRRLGGADQVITFEYDEPEGTAVKITTDQENKISEMVYVQADGETFPI